MNFTCADIGTQTVTLTASDGTSNVTAACNFNVVDNSPPTANCPASIPDVVLDASGNGTLPANIGDGSSTDNCSATETSPVMNFTCTDIGSQTVTLTASDGTNTNSTNCTFNVVDNSPPMATCPASINDVVLDASGNGSLPADIGGGLSTDNCTPTETSPVLNFTCVDIGIQMVTLTVTDGTNTVSKNCSFNVVDNSPPTAICPASINDVALDASGNGSLPADIGDGSSTDNCSAVETSPSMSFTCDDLGLQTVVLTADDGINPVTTAECSFYVTDVLHPCCPPTHIVYLDEFTLNDYNGADWDNAFASLQVAIAQANKCPIVTEIWVAKGTYLPGTTRTDAFVLKNGLAIYGGFDGGETMLSERDWETNTCMLNGDIGIANDDSDNSYHVIFNKNNGLTASALLDGFTITGGNADDLGDDEKGGGLYNENASPTIRNCHFLSNSAGFSGGGAYFKDSASKIDSCTFSDNSAGVGGASSNGSNTTTEFTACSFLDNSASINGGAIFNNSALLCGIYNCHFSNNSAIEEGGAIQNLESSPDIFNSAFLANTADEGGAINNWAGSDPNIVNCSFHNNMATSYGSAIRNHTGTIPLITNCIVWGNTAGVVDEEISNAVPGPIIAHSIVKQASGTFPGTGNLNENPLFASATDLQLMACSPAINTGSNVANGTMYDLSGNTRTIGTIDMGPFEVQGTVSGTNTWTGNGSIYWNDPANWSDLLVPGKLPACGHPDGEKCYCSGCHRGAWQNTGGRTGGYVGGSSGGIDGYWELKSGCLKRLIELIKVDLVYILKHGFQCFKYQLYKPLSTIINL